jgi:hypothetical protein
MYFQCRAIREKQAAAEIFSSSRGASRRSERLSKMATVAYEDEETQDQIHHDDPYASDYHPNSESETDSEDHIVSLASMPIPSARTSQFALREIPSSQAGPSGVRAGRRPCTPLPSKQVSQVCSINSQLSCCMLHSCMLSYLLCFSALMLYAS